MACAGDHSLTTRPLAIRQQMHCGWLPRREWRDPPAIPKSVGMKPWAGAPGVTYAELSQSGEWTPDVCPGWLFSQPLIVEAGMAFDAYEKGCFADMYPDPSNVLVEAVMDLSRAVSNIQAQRLSKPPSER